MVACMACRGSVVINFALFVSPGLPEELIVLLWRL